MIVVYHKNNKVVTVEIEGESIVFSQTNIAKALFEIVGSYPNQLISWCHVDFKSNLNLSQFPNVFHHHKIMASYNPFQNSFLSDAIGYVEESPFIKINKQVSYPTWQMSSCVGGVHASVLLALKDEIKASQNFDYFLHSIAKLAMPKGLLCYSEPRLLENLSDTNQKNKKEVFTLFRFVKEHYKTRWVFLLFLNLFLYERKIAILQLLSCLFYRRKKLSDHLLDKIQVQSTKKVVELGTIDVVIPTIGRKKYLFDVLIDLRNQTHLPKKVIIVEQNPKEGTTTELDYLINEKWPFEIKHIFTHQAGACNARNIAIAEVKSEWLFLNDDDNRFEVDLLERVLEKAQLYGINCLTSSYILKNEVLKYTITHQSGIFGSGNSFLKSEFLKFVSFNISLEFGYGEDTDFGLQLRNLGTDVIYFPDLSIFHLKAPMGGFRTKFVFPWEIKGDLPKPSPTIMNVKMRYLTRNQLMGYKLVLFLKLYRINFFAIPKFNKKWELSLYWANKLNENERK